MPPAVPNPVFAGHGLQAASGATSIPLLAASKHAAAEEKVLSLLLKLSKQLLNLLVIMGYNIYIIYKNIANGVLL